MGGVLVAEMSSSLRRISSLSLGYSSNRSAKPESQDTRIDQLCLFKKNSIKSLDRIPLHCETYYN